MWVPRATTAVHERTRPATGRWIAPSSTGKGQARVASGITRHRLRPSRSSEPSCSSTKRLTAVVVEHRVGPSEDGGHAASSSTAGPSRVEPTERVDDLGRERSIGAERRDEGVDVGARGRVGQLWEPHPADRDAADGSHPDRGHQGEPIRAEAELPTAGDHREQPLPELLRPVGADLRAGVAQVRVGEAAECLLGERPGCVDAGRSATSSTSSTSSRTKAHMLACDTASAIVVQPATRPP